MTDQLAIVQFPHPGGEWPPDNGGGTRGWTSQAANHRRKFIRHPGVALQRNGTAVRTELGFWGEWEACSTVEVVATPVADGPRWIHRPTLGRPEADTIPQNTDPFVFGSFLYTGCRQEKRRPHGKGWYPTSMRNLAKGSLVLFGSVRRGRFWLDTVFVVDRHQDHDHSTYEHELAGQVPEAYWDVTLHPWYWGPATHRSYRLYQGRRRDDSPHFFSFVPCRPLSGAPSGFKRPVLYPDGLLKHVISPSSAQNYHITTTADQGYVTAVWSAVVEQVQDQGCDIGVEIGPVPWSISSGSDAEAAAPRQTDDPGSDRRQRGCGPRATQ